MLPLLGAADWSPRLAAKRYSSAAEGRGIQGDRQQRSYKSPQFVAQTSCCVRRPAASPCCTLPCWAGQRRRCRSWLPAAPHQTLRSHGSGLHKARRRSRQPQQPSCSLLATTATSAMLDAQRLIWRSGGGLRGGLLARGASFTLQLLSSALALCRMRDGAAVEQLLQLGARPDAGFDDWGTALCALHSLVNLFAGDGEGVFESVIHPFLRRGLDPLAPEFAGVFYSGSLFRSCYHPELQQQLLAYLEGQHAAGQLQIASKEAAAELVCGCCQAGRWDHPLVAAGIVAVEATFGAGAAPDSPDDHVLVDLLFRLVDSPQPAPLAALLSTSLPLPLHLRSNHSSWAVREPFPDVSVSLLVRAALSKTAHKDNWRLLQQAGTPVTADDLYNCIDELSSTGVRAVLACRLPAVDTSQPVSTPQRHASLPRYSCPIHRTLHALTQVRCGPSGSCTIPAVVWCRLCLHRMPDSLLDLGTWSADVHSLRMPAWCVPTAAVRPCWLDALPTTAGSLGREPFRHCDFGMAEVGRLPPLHLAQRHHAGVPAAV